MILKTSFLVYQTQCPVTSERVSHRYPPPTLIRGKYNALVLHVEFMSLYDCSVIRVRVPVRIVVFTNDFLYDWVLHGCVSLFVVAMVVVANILVYTVEVIPAHIVLRNHTQYRPCLSAFASVCVCVREREAFFGTRSCF